MTEDFIGDMSCICSRCRKKFDYGDAVVKTRKLYNTTIEEKTCPFCGSKEFTRIEDIYNLAQIASHHRFGQQV